MRAEGGLALGGGVAWEQVAPGNYWNRDLTPTSGYSCMIATWRGLGCRNCCPLLQGKVGAHMLPGGLFVFLKKENVERKGAQ